MEEDCSSAECSESYSSGVEETLVENVELKLCEVDEKKEEALQDFVKNTCGCSLKEGEPCSGYFGVAELKGRRMMMAELDSRQLDCVILGQIGAHHFSGKLTGHCPKGTPRKP